ncbi:DUF302 domain-containing protein [Campylobacter geochelonis]|uniref:Uncharacterized conserved protein n=1 Tax=Campylobacter geochelonis TaxID=1780362 RepID=A0A128EC85_9BACT|nr:DUF302 domain-containing protein [Campylobacter geochelonis]QKF70659.1 DUF302 domain-containing protein [Campylobacter geochelonis]CZE45838.1 Uncharacterized conserved protein [Campylobacter geochelonis]CZE46801.1 Uncharacterized conserved protein [Campylobacter geochelonis]CZE50296.1 Uncharacterized conserved protein [Campylobacter geochelonis]
MRKTLLLLAVCATFLLGDNKMLTTATSPLSVDETASKLTNILESKGLKIFGVFEHSKLAKEAGLDMSDTVVVAFGAPKAGTPLMQCAPQIALELPLKILIYKNSDGKTTVAYEDIKEIAKRYDAQDCAPVENLSKAQANFFNAITK